MRLVISISCLPHDWLCRMSGDHEKTTPLFVLELIGPNLGKKYHPWIGGPCHPYLISYLLRFLVVMHSLSLQMVSFLLPVLEDKQPLVRSSSCWTLSRYSRWLVQVRIAATGVKDVQLLVGCTYLLSLCSLVLAALWAGFAQALFASQWPMCAIHLSCGQLFSTWVYGDYGSSWATLHSSHNSKVVWISGLLPCCR